MYFLRYCIMLIIFTLIFYIITAKASVEEFSQIQEFNKSNIMKLKGKLFRNYIIKNKVCNTELSPSISPSTSPNIQCIYDKELHNLNPCLNDYCKTFDLNGNLYHLSYENRPLETLSPFKKKHFGEIRNKRIDDVSINNKNEIQKSEDIIIPSKMGNKNISELGHCLDNCCNQIIGSKTGNVWDRKRSIFDKKLCKVTSKRDIKPQVNSDIFNYLLGGNIKNDIIFEYKTKKSHIRTC